jgi:hypothetical protein
VARDNARVLPARHRSTTVYNGARYLDEAIDSILPRFTDFECHRR